jgi:hypothetical protein
MSESTAIVDSRSLSLQQSQFIDNIVSGMNYSQAARLAGYSAPPQDGSRLMKIPRIINEIATRSAARIEGQLVPAAIGCLLEIITNKKAPASARVAASNAALDRSRYFQKAKQGSPTEAKDPESMSLDELNTFIQAGAAALASKRSSATAEDAVIVLDSAQNKADEHDIPSLDQ